MKKHIAAFVLLCFTMAGFSQDGYGIRVTLKPFTHQYIYLAHYYGSGLPIIDSAMLDGKSEAVFKGDKKLGGGIYCIAYPGRSGRFEFLLDKEQHFSILADTLKIDAITYINSKDNTAFGEYMQFMAVNGNALDSLERLKKRSGKVDSIRLAAEAEAVAQKIKQYRSDIIAKSPNSLLAVLLQAMKQPEVPKDPAAEKNDSLYAYHYFKAHYWDGVSFSDDRLIRTPFFDGRINMYFDQFVYPVPDSVNKELDGILRYAVTNEETQKYLLRKFMFRYLFPQTIWGDAVFMHLYKKYFEGKNYSWLTEEAATIYKNAAQKLEGNYTGSYASDIWLKDPSGKPAGLYGTDATYTIVVFWDQECRGCISKLQELNTAYQNWKAKGVKVFAMASRQPEEKRPDWMELIKEYGLTDWVHVYYSIDEAMNTGSKTYLQQYDVDRFPVFYLLDKEKRIIARKATIEQLTAAVNAEIRKR